MLQLRKNKSEQELHTCILHSLLSELKEEFASSRKSEKCGLWKFIPEQESDGRLLVVLDDLSIYGGIYRNVGEGGIKVPLSAVVVDGGTFLSRYYENGFIISQSQIGSLISRRRNFTLNPFFFNS